MPAIADLLTDPDMRAAALSALKQMGPDARGAASSVADLLEIDKAGRLQTLATLEALKISGPGAILLADKMVNVFADEKQKPVRDKTADVPRQARQAGD